MKIRKSLLSMLLLVVMLLSVFGGTTFAAGAPSDAKYSNQTFLVNGQKLEFDAYNIGGSNYIKLRDLAAAIKGTELGFNVGWDNQKSVINLEAGKAYNPLTTDLKKGSGQIVSFQTNKSPIYKDGKEVKLNAYTINNANYFKLRDLCSVFGIEIGFDEVAKTVIVNSDKKSAAPVSITSTFKVINNTGVDIYSLFITPSIQEDWSENILDNVVLTNNTYVDVDFIFTADALVWDIQIMDKDNNPIELYGLDFTNCSTDGGTIVLTYDSKTGIGEAEAFSAIRLPVTVTNQTGVDIVNLFMTPANQDNWGNNLIEGILKDTLIVNYVLVIDHATLVWDLKVSDSEGNEVEFIALDFSDVNAVNGANVVLKPGTDEGTFTATVMSK